MRRRCRKNPTFSLRTFDRRRDSVKDKKPRAKDDTQTNRRSRHHHASLARLNIEQRCRPAAQKA